MRDLLTPKQVARAIQVSESSIKRWCDKGLIPTKYTAGRHRRIPLSGLLEFLKAGQHELVRPEVLGLPATTGQTVRVIDRAADNLVEALLLGDEEQCRRIAFDLYLAEHSISAICDQVFAKAFQSIGDRWECGAAEVFQERRGCEIALRLLHQLQAVLPPAPTDAPLAIGGAPENDHYGLATTMAEVVLTDTKWNAASLGDNLPLKTLAAAIQRHRPRMFWLSCSHIEDETEFLDGYRTLYDNFGLDVAIVVGGRALTDGLRQQMKYAAYCENMKDLEGFGQTLLTADEKVTQLKR